MYEFWLLLVTAIIIYNTLSIIFFSRFSFRFTNKSETYFQRWSVKFINNLAPLW